MILACHLRAKSRRKRIDHAEAEWAGNESINAFTSFSNHLWANVRADLLRRDDANPGRNLGGADGNLNDQGECDNSREYNSSDYNVS